MNRNQEGQFLTQKQAEKPYKTLKIMENPSDILETFFFR